MIRSLLPLLVCLIAAGMAQTRAVASPNDALRGAVLDARATHAKNADAIRRTRYLPLWTVPEARRDRFRKALKLQANNLSRESEFGTPRLIGDDVVAVILDDYGWSKTTFENFRFFNFAFREKRYVEYPGYKGKYATYYAGSWLDQELIRELETLTGSRTPLVPAEVFFFYSSRQLDLNGKDNHGVGYYDWLALQKRADFESLGGVDRKTAIRLNKELRAALEEGRSGVAQKDRQIEWFAAYDGDYWLTLDTDDSSNGNNAPANLERGAFKHKAEEGYITLPNSLWAFWLGDEKGKRQNTAPDFIGPNDAPLRQTRDGRIHICQACIACHVNGGLQSVDDWARRTLKVPNQAEDEDYRKLLRFKRQYMSDLDGRIEKGRKRYAEALKACIGETPEKAAELHAEAYYAYLTPKSLAEVAVWVGCDEAKLKRALVRFFDSKNARVDENERRRLAALDALIAKNPSPLPTNLLEQFYQDLQYIVKEYGK